MHVVLRVKLSAAEGGRENCSIPRNASAGPGDAPTEQVSAANWQRGCSRLRRLQRLLVGGEYRALWQKKRVNFL